jgi:hypothetical protein
MSLEDWQTALALLVISPELQRAYGNSKSPFQNLDLGADDHHWLAEVVDATGFKMTCSIQRWWRQQRLESAVRLTLAAMPPVLRKELLGTWLHRNLATSFFYSSEAVSFLEFVLANARDVPHLTSICRLEKAAYFAAEFRLQSEEIAAIPVLDIQTHVARHPAATLVEFQSPPEIVLAAVKSATPLPELQDKSFPLLVAPGITELCRIASPAEACVWNACSEPRSFADLCQLKPPQSESAVLQLLAAGALIPKAV